MDEERRDYRAEVKAGPPNRKYKVVAKVMLMGTVLLVLLGLLVLAGFYILVWLPYRTGGGANRHPYPQDWR